MWSLSHFGLYALIYWNYMYSIYIPDFEEAFFEKLLYINMGIYYEGWWTLKREMFRYVWTNHRRVLIDKSSLDV